MSERESARAGIGRHLWAIAGGRIPLASTGEEPEFTSRDELAILNAGAREARIEITLYYPDREPIGPYELVVKAGRSRRLRFNDLIFPQAMPLEVDYAAVIRSDAPVVVQFTCVDTSHSKRARLGASAFPIDEGVSLPGSGILGFIERALP